MSNINTLLIYVSVSSEAFLSVLPMQHTGPKESLREGRNVDKECVDVQHCL